MKETPPGTMYVAMMHLSGVFGFVLPYLTVVPPWFLWWRCKDKQPGDFIDDQGREAMRFQFMMATYSLIAGVVVGFLGLGSFIIEMLAQQGIVMDSPPNNTELFMMTELCFTSLILIMQISAAWIVAGGRRYYYPFVFSPRRRAQKMAAS